MGKYINRKGSQFVEASIALPVVILGIMLMIRLFTFYLQILCTGIQEHDKALELIASYTGKGQNTYENVVNIGMMKGGLLGFDLSKQLETKAYLYNEDKMVRTKEGIL